MTAADKPQKEVIHTRIWSEEAEADNPFAAHKCLCAGYDVYGELIHKAGWFEYLYLLFKLERPLAWQALLLEKIALAIANPGIRDHSIRAAMNAGVGGSTSASALIAALAVGAGQYSGAREVYLMMQWWQECGQDLAAWRAKINVPAPAARAEVWQPIEHIPGFDPHGASCAKPILQTLDLLKAVSKSGHLVWLYENREVLEQCVDNPLAMTGVIAAAFMDLELTPDQGEMLFLLLRLPGAAVHALEQREYGWRKYPFFGNAIKLTNDPGPKES